MKLLPPEAAVRPAAIVESSDDDPQQPYARDAAARPCRACRPVHAQDRHASLSRGFQAHLVKPIEPRDLIRAMASILSRDSLA